MQKSKEKEKKEKNIFGICCFFKSKDYIKRETEFNLNSIYVEKAQKMKKKRKKQKTLAYLTVLEFNIKLKYFIAFHCTGIYLTLLPFIYLTKILIISIPFSNKPPNCY